MTYCWTAAHNTGLTNFPTAIWWLLREGNTPEKPLVSPFEIRSLSADQITLQDDDSELPSFGEIFRKSQSQVETTDINFEFGLLTELIDERLLREMVVRAKNNDLAAPILSEDSTNVRTNLIPAEPALEPDIDEKSVIVGIIDDEIAPAHKNFRNFDSTRFAHFWQQDAPPIYSTSGDPVFDRVPFGREYSHKEINDALAASTVRGKIEEQNVYRSLNMYRLDQNNEPRFSRRNLKFARTTTHGTHIADLAAGIDQSGEPNPNDPLNDCLPNDIKLIGVNLPTSVVADTAGTYFEVSAILGILRILEHVEAMEKKWASENEGCEQPLFVPVVINISFATMNAGRNGASLIEKIMDYSVRRRANKAPLRFVISAGNQFQSRQVATETISQDRPTELTVRVAPDCHTPTYVQVQLTNPVEYSNDSRVIAEIMPPTGAELSSEDNCFDPSEVKAVPNDTIWFLTALNDERLTFTAGAFYGWLPELMGLKEDNATVERGRETITIAIPPTASNDIENDRLPPPGNWRIRLRLGISSENPTQEDLDVDIRVLRNDIPTRNIPSPQRAWLLDQEYQRYDAAGRPNQTLNDPNSSVTRDKTINSFATGQESVVVGALRNTPTRLAPGEPNARIKISDYSSAGPISNPKADGDCDGVVIAAAGDDGYSLPGIVASGTHSGVKVRISGTSVAAPQITRLIAGALSKSSGHDDLRIGSMGWLKIIAKNDKFGPVSPTERVGGGGIASRRRGPG